MLHILILLNKFGAAAYCVVAVESAGRQVPIAFLERVKEDFNKRYGGGKAATATANSLNREFGYLSLYVSSHGFILLLLGNMLSSLYIIGPN